MPDQAALTEARRQIASLISKLEKTLPKLSGMKPQQTLAERRLAALRLSLQLIERELEPYSSNKE